MSFGPEDKSPPHGVYGDTVPGASAGGSTEPGAPQGITDPRLLSGITEPDALPDLEGTAETPLLGAMSYEGEQTTESSPSAREYDEHRIRDDELPTLPPPRFFDAATELGQLDEVVPESSPELAPSAPRQASPATPQRRPAFHDQPTQLTEDPGALRRFVDQPTQIKLGETFHDVATDVGITTPEHHGGERAERPEEAPTRAEPASAEGARGSPRGKGRRLRLLLFGLAAGLLVGLLGIGALMLTRPEVTTLKVGEPLVHGAWSVELRSAAVTPRGPKGEGPWLSLGLSLSRAGQVVRQHQVKLLLVGPAGAREPVLIEAVARTLGDDSRGSLWRLRFRLPAAKAGRYLLRFAPADERLRKLAVNATVSPP